LGEKEIVKVGGTRTIPIDVRVIAATNKDLEGCVKKGDFREDLYWRLAVLSLHLPPLRERKEDIPLLFEYLIQKFNKQLDKDIKGVSKACSKYMKDYTWPGNVRELESVLYEAMVMSDSSLIREEDLPARITEMETFEAEDIIEQGRPLNETIHKLSESVEKRLIQKALLATGGNKTNAAQRLGISRKTLFNKMSQYGLQSKNKS